MYASVFVVGIPISENFIELRDDKSEWKELKSLWIFYE